MGSEETLFLRSSRGFDAPQLNPTPHTDPNPAPYPDTRTARDAWILTRRTGIARAEGLDPRRAAHWLRETEPDPTGDRLRS